MSHRERIRERRRAWRSEREMWRKSPHRSQWLPWWFHARMRRRIFFSLALALAGGVAMGYRLADHARWWWIAIGLIVISIISGAIAWRLTRPLLAVVAAARDIGDGKLDTRLEIVGHYGEMRVLASALNDMASKIAKQLADQRELLAAVSHELRTPLGHMKILVETARERGASSKELEELDREIAQLDELVGKLLASSRLDFGNLDRRPIDLATLVGDLATAAGVPMASIEARGEVAVSADPSLVRRAVANLLDNAGRHGGGAVAVRVEQRGEQIAIEVDDAGPGIASERRADAFRAFVPSTAGGLGLGLALVSRIAHAHGGEAWISDRPGGGARVGFSVAAHD